MGEVAAFAPFLIIAGAMTLMGLSQMHASSHGGSGALGWLEGVVSGAVATLINLASQALRALTSRYAAAQLAILASFLSGMAVLWRFLIRSPADYAHASATAIEAVWRAIPAEVAREVAPLRSLARRAESQASRALARVGVVAAALAALKTIVNRRLHHLEHAVSVTLPHEIGKIRTAERDLERIYRDLRGKTTALERGAIKTFEWLRSHENSAAMGVFAGAVAIALSRLGFGFLRCRDWQKLGRSMRCSDAGLIGDLLGLIVAAEVALNFETLVREAQGVTEESTKAIKDVFGL